MSNQFYSYIAELLYNFFKDHKLKPGERYYLQLERPEDAQRLVQALEQLPTAVPFFYQHQYGDPYETIALDLDATKLVIAFNSEQVKSDFLVTLRNQVGEQKDVWNGTALLSIVSSQLDSIQGGSSDLQKEGMPLHPNSIIKVLKKEIETSILSKVEKVILLDRMNQIVQDQYYQQITFFEFEDIFSTLKKGVIEDEDYKHFGIFKDSELETYSGTKLSDRLEKNRELFDFIRKCHEYGMDEEQLEKKLSPAGIQKIKNSDWYNLSFSEILHYHNEALEATKKEKVELKEVTVNNKLTIWDRPQRETTAGNRKRHIIIFNNQYLEEIILTASFSIESSRSKSLSERYVKIEKKYLETTSCSVGRVNLTIKIKPELNGVTFTKLSYQHDGKRSLGAEFFIAVVPTVPDTLASFKTNYFIDPKLDVIRTNFDGKEIIFGNGAEKHTHQLMSQNETIEYSEDKQIIIEPQPEAFNDEDQLRFFIKLQSGVKVPFLLVNDVPDSIPITSFRIWKLKREQQQNFTLSNNRLIFGNREFYIGTDFKQFCDWEFEWLESGLKCAEVVSGMLAPVDIEISDDLKMAYNRFINYFKIEQNVPSLCYFSSDLQVRAQEYVRCYINEIRSFQEGQPAGKRGRDLFKLGLVFSHQGLYLSPFHPLMVAYQLQLYKELLKEDLGNNILSRLKPDSLLPFVYMERNGRDELFRPFPQNGAIEWLEYRPVS